MTQHVLVTGGAGYIGSHTCKLLHEKGYVPIVLDSLIYGHRSFVKWGPFFKGDIADSEILAEIFKQFRPVAVIHFAAFAYVGESVSDPAKYYSNNVSGTLSLLESMRKTTCSKIVFSSSCATYGIPGVVPIDEKQPQAPINPYGNSKLMVEKILRDYDHAYGIKSVSLRYFNAAGCDPEGEIGEDHTPETHLIPLAIYNILGKTQYLEIFGTDYDTEDGTAVRDYIHVNDLAEAHIKSIEFIESEKISDTFNLGTGNGISVQEIVDTVNKVTEKQVNVVYGKRRTGDPGKLVADASKANRTLNWLPKRSDVNTIVSDAWKWHQKNC